MFIAMNRFQVKKGSEQAFETLWATRESYLSELPGFIEFHLLRGPDAVIEEARRMAAEDPVVSSGQIAMEYYTWMAPQKLQPAP